MTPPAQPYITIQTARVSGTISVGGTFSWYNSGTSPCTVSNVSPWCTASSYGPIAPGGSASATVNSAISAGSYSFACPCCEVNQPSIGIHGGHPKP